MELREKVCVDKMGSRALREKVCVDKMGSRALREKVCVDKMGSRAWREKVCVDKMGSGAVQQHNQSPSTPVALQSHFSFSWRSSWRSQSQSQLQCNYSVACSFTVWRVQYITITV